MSNPSSATLHVECRGWRQLTHAALTLKLSHIHTRQNTALVPFTDFLSLH